MFNVCSVRIPGFEGFISTCPIGYVVKKMDARNKNLYARQIACLIYITNIKIIEII